MTEPVPEKDLIVLAADGQTEFAIHGLLGRGQSIGFQNFSFDIHVHPERDPGCLVRGHDFLRPFCRQYRHAIMIFDREGSGKDECSRAELEAEVEQRLRLSGWQDRAAAVVIDPELEIWVWSDSPVVDDVLGWSGRTPRLGQWLQIEGYFQRDQRKPNRPKEAMERAMRIVRRSRSSAIFRELAERVSVNRCLDPAFLKLKTVLQTWFGAASHRSPVPGELNGA
jgi:hypothetical protein